MTIDISVLINKKMAIRLARIRISSGLPRFSVLMLRWNGTTTNAPFTKGDQDPLFICEPTKEMRRLAKVVFMSYPPSDIICTVDADIEDTVLFEPVATLLLKCFPVTWTSSNPAPERLGVTRHAQSTFSEFNNHRTKKWLSYEKDNPVKNVCVS